MQKSLTWEGHSGRVLDSVPGFDVLDCATCRFKHVVPLPTPQELERIYREDFYSTTKPAYIDHQQADRAWWDVVYDERLAEIERIGGAVGRMLDVGSGAGHFLVRANARGWTSVGVEPSRLAAAHARELGVETIEATLTPEVASKVGRFDAVHMQEVLEHVPDPAAMLDLCRATLGEGGLLMLVVPNDYNAFQTTLRDHMGLKPWWVCPPVHLSFFDGPSLESLLVSRGFEVVSREVTFPIDMFLLMGENYVGNETKGREVHARRKAFEMNLAKAGRGDVKRRLYRAMYDAGIGRELVLIARKRA